MFTEGYINIHRKILNWEWYSDINVYRVFTHLLFIANYRNTRWQDIDVNIGQVITSREQLAKQTGLTEQQVRTALNKLQKTGEITIKTTNKFTLITVEKYSFYQFEEKKITNRITSKITNNQPANHRQNNQQIKRGNCWK